MFHFTNSHGAIRDRIQHRLTAMLFDKSKSSWL
jgi:hypothetical protein